MDKETILLDISGEEIDISIDMDGDLRIAEWGKYTTYFKRDEALKLADFIINNIK